MIGHQFGLLACCEDLGTSIRTFICPCVVAGENAGSMDRSCMLYGLLCLIPCCMLTNGTIREQIRHKYNIQVFKSSFVETKNFQIQTKKKHTKISINY